MADSTPKKTDATTTPLIDDAPLDVQEQNLRIQELQLKVDALKRPEYKKISTWTGVIAIAAAIVSFIVQGYYYKIQNAQAEQDLKTVKVRLDSASKTEALIRTHLRLTQDSARTDSIALLSMNALRIIAARNLDSFKHEVEAEKAALAKLPDGQGKQAISKIDRYLNNTQQAVTAQVENGPRNTPVDHTAASPVNADAGHPLVPDDPQKNQWGGKPERDGRIMTATVKGIAYHSYQITITVTSTDPNKPLTGNVRFHLHNTFRNQNPLVPVVDGKAVLSLVAVGSFTVGAETDDGVKLEYDLVNAPQADDYFKTH